VALTFDDGPTPGKTDAILTTLAEHDVNATFFLVGEAMRQHPNETRRIVAAGHEVGNHSYSHSRMLMKSLEFVADEIETTSELIRQAGFEGEIRFRPPYGKRLLVLPWYLYRDGITTVTWDSAPESDLGLDASAEEITERVVNTVRPGSIVLMHVMFDSRAESMKAVPQVIEGLRAQGYRFVTISELMTLRDS
jgi:peptidoglycan/xylan/chitin deacetylase (PgdA/CDA1 family)